MTARSTDDHGFTVDSRHVDSECFPILLSEVAERGAGGMADDGSARFFGVYGIRTWSIT
ncbi:MAG: hypothetical protein ACI8TP_001859 [Acidimicrobiales bacterium]|jgi:hypothetical protein